MRRKSAEIWLKAAKSAALGCFVEWIVERTSRAKINGRPAAWHHLCPSRVRSVRYELRPHGPLSSELMTAEAMIARFDSRSAPSKLAEELQGSGMGAEGTVERRSGVWAWDSMEVRAGGGGEFERTEAPT